MVSPTRVIDFAYNIMNHEIGIAFIHNSTEPIVTDTYSWQINMIFLSKVVVLNHAVESCKNVFVL